MVVMIAQQCDQREGTWCCSSVHLTMVKMMCIMWCGFCTMYRCEGSLAPLITAWRAQSGFGHCPLRQLPSPLSPSLAGFLPLSTGDFGGWRVPAVGATLYLVDVARNPCLYPLDAHGTPCPPSGDNQNSLPCCPVGGGARLPCESLSLQCLRLTVHTNHVC